MLTSCRGYRRRDRTSPSGSGRTIAACSRPFRSTSMGSRSGSRRRSTSGCFDRACEGGSTTSRPSPSSALLAMDLLYQNSGWRAVRLSLLERLRVRSSSCCSRWATGRSGGCFAPRRRGASRGISSVRSRSIAPKRTSIASTSGTAPRPSSTNRTEPCTSHPRRPRCRSSRSLRS